MEEKVKDDNSNPLTDKSASDAGASGGGVDSSSGGGGGGVNDEAPVLES